MSGERDVRPVGPGRHEVDVNAWRQQVEAMRNGYESDVAMWRDLAEANGGANVARERAEEVIDGVLAWLAAPVVASEKLAAIRGLIEAHRA